MKQTWKNISKSVQRRKRQTHIFIYTELTERHRLELHVNQSYVVCVFCVCVFFAQRARSF